MDIKEVYPSMQYKVGKEFFGFSYQEVKDSYERHLSMSDKKFIKNLPSAIHLAVFICYLKQIPAYNCLADDGIVHELVHLLHLGESPHTKVKKIRKQFKKELKLA